MGLYPSFTQDKSSKAFKNNLVIYEDESLSSKDDGQLTIYSMGKR
jgi:hypothetical protein